MAKLILGYWDIRGLGEPARLMLEYGGVDYEDKRYKLGQEPPYDGSDWFDRKFNMDLDFPNLPYIIDGDLRITESHAVYRYIARKNGIFPETAETEAKCDMLEGVIYDLISAIISLVYSKDFKKLKAERKLGHQEKMKKIEKYLSDKKFLAGDDITQVDFLFFEVLDHHRLIYPDFFDDFTNLQAFLKRFESLDKIAAYRKSDRFKKFPLYRPTAQFGGKKE